MGTVIYTRISLDLADGAGVARQEADCRELAAREGLDVSKVYSDNSVSAYSGAVRPAFEQLLEDVKAGMVDTVIVWATDRLYRRLADLERLVDSLGETPVLAVKSGRINLATADGRMQARILGAVAQHEGEKKAERVSAAARQRSMRGRSASSSRPFGWRRLDGGGLAPDAREGHAVAHAYDLLLRGETLSGIARWLDAEGFTGTRGGTWTQSNVSALLRQPRHGGLVSYLGKLVAAPNVEGSLVDETKWRQAQRILDAPGRRRRPGRPAETLLAGFLTCYKCGGIVRASSNQIRAGQRYKTYACAHNHVSWRREDLDALVTADVLDVLRRAADAIAAAAEDLHDSAQGSADVLADIQRLREDRQDLADALAAGRLRATAYAVAAESVEAALARAEARLVPAAPPIGGEVFQAGDPVAAFESAGLRERRGVLAEFVDTIVVHPKRSDRIDVEWKIRFDTGKAE